MDLIKELKENLAEFDQMSKELQAEAKRIGKKNFLILLSNGYFAEKAGGQLFPANKIFRLRPDYEEPAKAKLVLYGIRDQDNIRDFYYQNSFWTVPNASRFLGHAGFMMPDKTIFQTPIVFREVQSQIYVWHATKDQLESGEVEIVRATHVVYEVAK